MSGHTIRLLVVALTVAFAAPFVRGREGIRRTAPAAANAEFHAATPLVEPDALYRAVRLERAARNGGWVSSWEPRLGPEPKGETGLVAEDSLGAPIPWAPGYDLLLAALHRGATPSPAVLFEGDEGKGSGAKEPEARAAEDEREAIEALVATTPRILAGLTALLAALLAGLLVRGPGSTAAAAIAGVGVTFAGPHVQATAYATGSSAGWSALLLLAAMALTTRAWMQPRINQPFWSSMRGGLVGLLAGLAILSDPAALLAVMLLQVAFILRLLVPFREQDGKRVPARCFPVFVTSFHKVGLLVVLPGTVENPFVSGDPMGIVGVTWLPLAVLGVGWLAFAPYALVPRLVGKRPWAALAPAVLLALAVGFGTDAATRLGDFFVGDFFVGGDVIRPLEFGWALLLPLLLIQSGATLGRRPELLPVLVSGVGLLVLTGFGAGQPAWFVAPCAAAIGVLVVPQVIARMAPVSRFGPTIALSVVVALMAYHPSTLSPKPDLRLARAALDGEAVGAAARTVEVSGAAPWVLNDAELGALVLWRTELSPAAVELGAGVMGAADADAQAAGPTGYRWQLRRGDGGADAPHLELVDLAR